MEPGLGGDNHIREKSLKHSLVLSRMATAVRELVQWWQKELRAMVPKKWLQWSQTPLRVEAGASELRIYDKHQPHAVDRIDIDDTSPLIAPVRANTTRCELLMEEQQCLMTPLTLPLAAEANLRNVIGFSMDRYTPFKEEDVYFDFRVVHRDREHEKIELILYVVPRTILDGIIHRLEAAGIDVVTADVLELRQDGAREAGINLLPVRKGKLNIYRRRINSYLLAGAVLLVMAIIITPLYQRHGAVTVLELEIQQMRKSVQEAEQLRTTVNARSDALRTMLKRRNSTPPTLELLRELTRLTPDEAWASQVEIRGGRIRITGEAQAGSELLQALTASHYFADPRFEAPLTQNPRSGHERYVISLAIREMADAH